MKSSYQRSRAIRAREESPTSSPMVVRRLDLEERVDLDNVEGTSEASLAASAPREAQMLYQPMNRGQDLTGRDSGVRSSPERQSSDLS